jgi:hypothetical protein
MYQQAAEGYRDLEGHHEADIPHLQEQLSLLAATDCEPDPCCWPPDEQLFVPRGEPPARASMFPGDVANIQSAGDAPPIRGMKRGLSHRMLKR